MNFMADPIESSDVSPTKSASASDQWLGGEAFLGNSYRQAETARQSRVWSDGEALVLFLGGLTLGTAIGLVFSRSQK
jgi:hypothetical protein